jgi:methyltransferase-like protein
MEEEIQDDFGYELAIGSILWNIEKREKLSDVSKLYIDWVKGYFQEINKTIDSISYKDYIFTPHFIEVVQSLADKPQKEISIEDLVKYKDEFNSINTKLENLKTNPQEFYKSKDSEYISNFMNKIHPLFQTPHVPFMTCCGEDIGNDD